MEAKALYPLQLVDVRLYTMGLERLETTTPTTSVTPESTPEPLGTFLGIAVKIARNPERKRVSAFLTIEIKGPDANRPEFHLNFTLEGLFEAQLDLDAIEETIWKEFENTSAVTLLWPYAREYTHSFARRMRADLPVLPTLNRLGMQQAAAAAMSPDEP